MYIQQALAFFVFFFLAVFSLWGVGFTGSHFEAKDVLEFQVGLKYAMKEKTVSKPSRSARTVALLYREDSKKAVQAAFADEGGV